MFVFLNSSKLHAMLNTHVTYMYCCCLQAVPVEPECWRGGEAASRLSLHSRWAARPALYCSLFRMCELHVSIDELCFFRWGASTTQATAGKINTGQEDACWPSRYSHTLLPLLLSVLAYNTAIPVYSGGPWVDQQWLYYRGWLANTGPNACYGDFGAH